MRTVLLATFLIVTTISHAGADCQSRFDFVGQSKYEETDSGYLVMVVWIGVGIQSQIIGPRPPDSNDDSMRSGLMGSTRSYAFMDDLVGGARSIYDQNLSTFLESEECQTIATDEDGARFDCTHMGRVNMSPEQDELGEYWNFEYLPRDSILSTDEYRAAEALLEKLTDAAVSEVSQSLQSK